MKILYVTTIAPTMKFFRFYIAELIRLGHTVDIACNDRESSVDGVYREMGCGIYTIDCSRSPFSAGNLRAIGQIKRIVEENGYDIVHCHTPIAAACTRIACKGARKKGTRVFYTAHGFHFYRGAPIKNWLIFYPVEKFCARMTDILFTINREDYALAKSKLRAGKIEYVPGVGIDVQEFAQTTVERGTKRAALGIPEDAFLLLSVGELNQNKNHAVVIRAVAACGNPCVHYAIAGRGELQDELLALAAQLGISERLHLLGYREDVDELYRASDLCVFPSFREGLGLAAIEGMAAGLPLLVSDNRGTRDYAIAETNAIICRPDDIDAFASAITRFSADPVLCATMGAYNRDAAMRYDVHEINRRMLEIYEEK